LNKVERIRCDIKAGTIKPALLMGHFKHMDKKRFVSKIEKYCNEDLFKNDRYLFIRKNKKVNAICSHCRHETILKKVPKQRSKHHCENCNSTLEVRNVKFFSCRDRSYKEYIHFDKSSLDPKIMIAYQFNINRTIIGDQNYLNSMFTKDEIKISACYYFDIKSKCVLMESRYWENDYYIRESFFIANQGQWYFSGYDDKSLEVAIENTNLKINDISFVAKFHLDYRC